MKAKGQKWAASLLRGLKSFHLKPEHCAVLPCAELVLYVLLRAFPGRQNSPADAKAVSLRIALLQPSHSSQAPALAVQSKVIQYQIH